MEANYYHSGHHTVPQALHILSIIITILERFTTSGSYRYSDPTISKCSSSYSSVSHGTPPSASSPLKLPAADQRLVLSFYTFKPINRYSHWSYQTQPNTHDRTCLAKPATGSVQTPKTLPTQPQPVDPQIQSTNHSLAPRMTTSETKTDIRPYFPALKASHSDQTIPVDTAQSSSGLLSGGRISGNSGDSRPKSNAGDKL